MSKGGQQNQTDIYNEDQKDNNQPQITIQEQEKQGQQDKNRQNLRQNLRQYDNKCSNEKSQQKSTSKTMKEILQRHPDCIPIFYVKHSACSAQFPSPKCPFILFKKSLLIQQAMYTLYNQIEIKGLYFFCTKYSQKQKKLKHIMIKPGETIQKVYQKYGKDSHLTLIYGDNTMGMKGVDNIQKYLIRILIFLVILWIAIFAYPYYQVYQYGGLNAVVQTFQWFRKDKTQRQTYQNITKPLHNSNNQLNDQQLNQNQSIKQSNVHKALNVQEKWGRIQALQQSLETQQIVGNNQF